MEWLLIGVFTFFGIHTLLWFIRYAAVERLTRPCAHSGAARTNTDALLPPLRRIDRVMHAFLMLSFVGCALTGLPLLFADHAWATTVAGCRRLQVDGLIHRVCAVS